MENPNTEPPQLPYFLDYWEQLKSQKSTVRLLIRCSLCLILVLLTDLEWIFLFYMELKNLSEWFILTLVSYEAAPYDGLLECYGYDHRNIRVYNHLKTASGS